MSGRIQLEDAKKRAEEVVEQLAPYCEKIEVAGSIRRRRRQVNDIDIVLIPKDWWGLHNTVKGLGESKAAGGKIMRVMSTGTQIDIYVASAETWATLLLIRTGSAQNNIRLCSIAKNRGWQLHADGSGLFNEKGERIAGDTEQSIYQALGVHYQEPWERD